jgi:phosphotransferase system enzyme I (PtsI)
MAQLEGVPLSSGYAVGTAVIYECEVDRHLAVQRSDLSSHEIATEHGRLDRAVADSHGELHRSDCLHDFHADLTDVDALLSVHSRMVSEVAAIVRQRVSDQFVNAEYALDEVINEFVKRLGQVESEYFRQREQDVRDVGRRMMRHLTGSLHLSQTPLPADSVIVATELLPSEAVELVQSGLTALVMEHAGRFSHTAILARSLRIPAVGGVPHATSFIKPGQRLLVDGESGRVTIAPTPGEADLFAAQRKCHDWLASVAAEDDSASGGSVACTTADGVDVTLLANVGRTEEMGEVLAHNCGGVGLFRTEFIYLEASERPTYEDQVTIYRRVAEQLDGLPLVIRTFDLGGDKRPPFLENGQTAANPLTQLRGLRFSLDEKRLLETQLRAIAEVAQEHDARILLPMVLGGHDMSLAVSAIEDVLTSVGAERRPRIGAMIETPAALFALDEILDLADFVSIGTNDLTQYMLAANRDLASSSDDFSSLHPSVLRAIKQVVDAADARRCPLCVCGEEAGDVDFACLLIGLGVRELSLSPERVVSIRHALAEINADQAGEVAQQALQCRSPREVRNLSLELQAPIATRDPWAYPRLMDWR